MITKKQLTIATRESPLAWQQAESVKALLEAYHPELNIQLLGITTEADKRLNIPLIEMGGKGLFVKELEEALLDGRADIAVHSMKDVPMDLPPGFSLPVMIKRDEPRDVFVSNKYSSLMAMPPAAALGTSSLRRQTQIRLIRPDVQFFNLRGNINTRLNRLDKGDYDGIILAGVGLKRLGLAERIRGYLTIEECLPAAGQGALGIECRENDRDTLQLITPLNNEVTNLCVSAERALCRQLGGGCKVPVAAFAETYQGKLRLRGLVSNLDSSHILSVEREGLPDQAEALGIAAAQDLLDQGAAAILKAFYD